SSKPWNAFVHGIYIVGMLWILIGVPFAIPASLPWFMDGWLALNGLLARPYVAWFGGVAALIGLGWWWGVRQPRWAVPLTASLCAASATVLAVGGERWCQPSRCEYLQPTSPYIRSNLIFAWRWIAENVTNTTVAYTGINLPYPLTGDRLTNRVIYVNTDGRQR